jgi:ATP-dependent helicase HrpB
LQAAAARGRIEDGAAIAAILAEKDLLPPADKTAGPAPNSTEHRGDSDLLVRLDLLKEAENARFSIRLRNRGIDPLAARRIAEARDELIRVGRPFARGSAVVEGDDILLALALIAYPDRVCRRRGEGLATARMTGGRGIRLDRSSVVANAEFFIAIDPREAQAGGGKEARVRIASAIDLAWLFELFPEAIRRDRAVSFDETRGRAVCRETTYYHDLPIHEGQPQPANPAESSQALATWLSSRVQEFISQDELASAWLERLTFLRSAMLDADLPEFDDAMLAEVITVACGGKTTLEAVRRVALVPLLLGSLTFAQARLVDEEAPESILVPTGNRIRLKYDGDRAPVLAVRLQEMFGLGETPRIAGGRVPVLLHLLGPNYRPVQITNDLKSFWNTTYFQVRKDLRNRYPKHSWPEDPWNAPPVAKGRPRK